MVVPFVVLLSTTGLNGGTVKLKKKRLIKHVVTISVTISILLALVIVAGILLAFELPPRNEKSTLKKINVSQDKENWKHQVHAVFAINLVGPKETRLRRSIENVKKYTLQVIRSLLFNYYGSDAQFVIQTYSTLGNSRIGDLCDAACTMRYVDQIDQDQETFMSDSPNQTDAVWQYYQYSLGRKPSIYILFVADRASYGDDIAFEKDMMNSNKILEETKLTKETVCINNANAARYFMRNNIISNGRSAFETANLINDKLISHYRNDNELNKYTVITTTTTTTTTITVDDSSQSVILHTVKEIASISINDDEKKSNHIVTQTIPKEFTLPTATFSNIDTLTTKEQVITASSPASIAQLKKSSKDEPSIKDIPKSTFDTTESGNQTEHFIIEKANTISTGSGSESIILNAYHFTTTQSPESEFTSSLQWTGNDDIFAGENDQIDVKKILESTDVSMQSESISTGQIVESVNNITTEITDMTNTSSKNSTQEYHTITEKLSHPGNTDSTVIEVSSKHQINNKLEEEKISEMSDSLFNASSSSTQTSSTAFVIETTIDSKSISDANPRMDNSENVGTSEHTTSDTFKIMSPSITTSLPLPEGSKGVTFNVIHTSTKNNAKFLMETTDSHTINLDSVTSSATIVPSLSSKALTMEEPILTEKLTSAEIDKSTRSTAGLSARNTATHSQISTIPAISQSHINDFAYSLEGFINASTSTTLDHSTHSRENSFSSGNEDEIGRTTIEPHQSTARTQANETELKGSTITESVRSAITSRAYSDTNMSNIPNILDATESGSSSRTQVHNRASTLEISRTIPEDASNNKSSAIISVPEVLKALIQEDKHPSPSDKNTEHFISGRTSSFFTTKFSTALGKTSPGNVIDLSGILTDTSLSSNDKELLMTTDEPLITDNLQQSTSNDLPSSTEASGIMKVTFSSLVANNLSKNSEFSTIAATDSSDDKLSNSFIIGKSHELISDSESADKPSAGSTAATISDEIIVASTFTVKLQKIFPNEIVFNSSQAIETSTTSTTSSMEDIIEISNATSEVTIEMKGIQNITTTLDDDIKFTTAATQIPMAVFNVTLPASQYDAYFLLHINRTSKNYNYLLLDEISYTNDMDSEAPDPSEIAVIMNDEINSLNNSGSDANETYTDFYADDSLSSVDDTVVEEKFRLANLALRNRYKMETATTSIPDGSMQTDAASNWVKNAEDQQHHHQFSTDGNSSSGHLAKNTIAVNTFENPTLSQNSEGLTKESDDTSSHHQENSTTESTQSTPLAQITNPIKIDFTFQGSRENFTVPIALHEVNSTALNGAENQSNTLPLNYISSTSVPEIEEIAAVNTNARKIVHQTLTVLEAEKSTGSDATLPVISTILWNSATSKPIIGLSSDQAFLKELSSTLAQPQIDESITESSTNNERSSTTETTDNIADTFRNSVTAIFFQQKRSIDKNDITPASTIILTGIQDDINISLVNRTTFNSTSTSVASFQDNLTRYSLTNGETLQPFSGTSKNSHLSYDKNIIDNFTKKETSQSFSGFSASGDISSDKSITDSRSSEFSSGISASNSFSSDTSIANDEERNTRT